jgi:hypothetical protein
MALLAWLAMIGFDFFLHAGLLARLYVEPSPFLLPPVQAFALIPVGYLSFWLFVVLLLWLMTRLGVFGWRRGFVFGLELGALTWGAFVLGLLSISTASLPLLIGWFVGQTVELGIGGAVVGSGLAGTSLRRLLLSIVVFVVGLFIITVALQTLGLVPATRM